MRTAPRRTAGFSLIELLIAMTMLMAITGATFALFNSQSVSFRRNGERFDLTQNARGSLELTERVIRTMGAGVVGAQPILVYGANNVLAFNTDYMEQDTVDMRWAAYWNPDAVTAETIVWEQSAATVIPNSSPNYTYPTTTYTMGNPPIRSPAETYIVYFQLDVSTARTDDYQMLQRVNAGTAEVLARNILPAADGTPFFQYLMQRTIAGDDTLMVASGSLLPLIRRQLTGTLSSADSANYVRPDSVRAIRMNYRITNGLTGTAERTRSVSTVIEVPNNGIPMPNVCGRAPYTPGSFSATDAGDGSGKVTLAWTRSDDQDGGERDVRQYVIFRRPSAATTFTDPLVVVAAEQTQVNYSTVVLDQIPGQSYVFGIAAQDCTPTFSTPYLTANVTVSTPP